MDEGWSDERDINGLQQANATRFPNGVGKIATYAHERNLKVGIYRLVVGSACSQSLMRLMIL